MDKHHIMGKHKTGESHWRRRHRQLHGVSAVCSPAPWENTAGEASEAATQNSCCVVIVGFYTNDSRGGAEGLPSKYREAQRGNTSDALMCGCDVRCQPSMVKTKARLPVNNDEQQVYIAQLTIRTHTTAKTMRISSRQELHQRVVL